MIDGDAAAVDGGGIRGAASRHAGRAGPTGPLCLHATALAGPPGLVPTGDERSVLLLPHPLVDTRVAIVTWPASDPAGGARVGVMEFPRTTTTTDGDDDNGDRSVSSLRPLRRSDASTLTTNPEAASASSATGAAPPRDDCGWSGAWSPDGRLLVLAGSDRPGPNEAPEPAVWLYSRREWIDGPNGRADGNDEDEDDDDKDPPFALRIRLLERLRADPQWRKRQPKVPVAETILAIVFPAHGQRCLVITRGGWLVAVELEMTELLLAARRGADATEDGARGLVRVEAVQDVGNWHAGLTAAAFDAPSATLVLSGGIQDPSDELRAQRASSLSVWRVTANAPYVQLLDYTMVLGPPTTTTDDNAQHANPPHDEGLNGNAVGHSEDSVATGSRNGTTGFMSYLNPLNLISSGDSQTATRGHITQLAISPSGLFVSVLDRHGQFLVRQVDVCADVTGWHGLECVALRPSRILQVTWISFTDVALRTSDNRVVYLSLSEAESSDDRQEDEESFVPRYRWSRRDVEVDALPISSGDQFGDKVIALACYPASCATPEAQIRFCLVRCGDLKTELILYNQVCVRAFADYLIAASQVDRVLSLVSAYREVSAWSLIDLDLIHREAWCQFTSKTICARSQERLIVIDTDEGSGLQGVCSFDQALRHLGSIQNERDWVVNQSLTVVSSNSAKHQKELLMLGLRTLSQLDGEQLEEKKTRLLRYIYRLDTLIEIGKAGCDDDDSEDGVSYDGGVFAHFRDANIVDVAQVFAREGRVKELGVLFRRNAWNLLPRRTDVLESLPMTLSPRAYAHLLPALPANAHHEWQLCTLRIDVATHSFHVIEVPLLDDNRSQDLENTELEAFEAISHQNLAHRRDEYGLWYTNRMVEMDSLYGQLHNAFELGRLGSIALAVNTDVVAPPFDDFIRSTDTLFRCVHVLRLPNCCLLTLEEWCLLSLHDQVMTVVEDFPTVEIALHRLRTVFLESRRHPYALDEVITWLCQVLMSPTRQSIMSLELCASLIHASNPSNAVDARWIQSDSRLLRTAIDVVYSASTSLASSAQLMSEQWEKHQRIVDQLWAIFQSLPVRKDDDHGEIEKLQVEVDGMEDLMIAMDILAKYRCMTTPFDLKRNLTIEGHDSPHNNETSLLDSSVRFCRHLVEEMCREGVSLRMTWMAIWEDAMKLKAHAIGERLNQDEILGVLLSSFLKGLQAIDEADVQDLISNWVSKNASAVPQVLEILLRRLRLSVDDDDSDSAQRIHSIAKWMLSLPVLATTSELDATRAKFAKTLSREINLRNVCELLDLLSYGMVKVSSSQIRRLVDPSDRLDLILQIYTSNPSHYRMPDKARAWLATARKGHPNSGRDQLSEVVLDGVFYLAKLLRLDERHKSKITVKASYSALYCADYDTACALASLVLSNLQIWVVPSEQRAEIVSLLMSLTLDLASASSFHSWDKKVALVQSIFAVGPGITEDFYRHPMMDALLDRLNRLDAIRSLARELGLSEADIETRRDQERVNGGKCSQEVALLKELDIVVDLLKEEDKDRQFILSLLQRGFNVLSIAHTSATLNPPSPSRRQRATSVINGSENAIWLKRVGTHMLVLSLQVSADATTTECDDSNSDDMIGLVFAYLLFLYGRFGIDGFEEAWRTEVAPLCSGGQFTNTILEKFHHFLLFLAASVAYQKPDLEQKDYVRLLQKLQQSYPDTKARFQDHGVDSKSLGEIDSDHFSGDLESSSLVIDRQHPEYVRLCALAQECEQYLSTYHQSKEVEAMSTLFNVDVDLDLFTHDEGYRIQMIRQISTSKQHLVCATQLATKYGIDEYECLMAYIRHAFLGVEFVRDTTSRQEQLEQAFRSDGEYDFLEHALQRPHAFGEFLLKPGSGIYDSLPGTDHIGILLVLRMVLECSKRATSSAEDDELGCTLFPLTKTASDRVTLLFMCLKRLKELPSEVIDDGSMLVPDFKVICAAQSGSDLLEQPSDMRSRGQAAIRIVLPFLNGKTIKILTKIFQKLYQANASTIVMIYLDYTLGKIWETNRDESHLAELAAYAYESCVPFLSVLGNNDLLLFYNKFLGMDALNHDVSADFYGQHLDSIGRYSNFIRHQKRMEIVSDNLGVVRGRAESSERNVHDSDLIKHLEKQLVEAAFWYVTGELKQFFLVDGNDDWIEHWSSDMLAWFSLDPSDRRKNEDHILNGFVGLSERVLSLDLATLLVELALCNTTTDEFAQQAVSDIYRKRVTDFVQNLLARQDEPLVDTCVTRWSTELTKPWQLCEKNLPQSADAELSRLLETFKPAASASNDASVNHLDVYNHVIGQLELLSLARIKIVAERRKNTGKHDGTFKAGRQYSTIVSQWREVTNQYEQQGNWSATAVLRMLEHLILSRTFAIALSSDDYMKMFAYRVRAVAEWLNQHDHADMLIAISELDETEVYSHFEDCVIPQFMSVVSSTTSQSFSLDVTIAVAIMVYNYGLISSEGCVSKGKWEAEKQRACLKRLTEGFGVGISCVEPEYTSFTESSQRKLWEVLLKDGVWDERLLQWYVTMAYDKIRSPDLIADYVKTKGDENPSVAIMVLLVCPFDELRVQLHEYIVTRASTLFNSPSTSDSTKARLLELLLLRWDLSALLGMDGFEPRLVHYLLHVSSQQRRKSSLGWTSTLQYSVCRLVMLGEFALASRLVCAAQQIHPLLWDLESARLFLGQYLKALAALKPKSDSPVETAITQARRRALEHYQKELQS